MGEITDVSDYPTADQIRQAYEPVFKFLDSILEIISETESANDSEILKKRADELDEQVADLVVPFARLAKLRALANQAAEPRRVEESDTWVADLASTLGQGIANWVRNIGYHLFSHELAAAGRRQLSPFDYQRPENPFTEEDFNRCRDLLVNEEALLIVTQKSAATQGSDVQAESPKAVKSDKKSQRKGSKGKQSISESSLVPLILAKLRQWHRYDTDNFRHEPVGIRELARQLSDDIGDPSRDCKSSISRFFVRMFEGHKIYCQQCHRGEMEFRLRYITDENLLNRIKTDFDSIAANLEAKPEQNRD